MRRHIWLAALLLPAAAPAATLRPVSTLAGPVVHLSDLWDEAGPAGARVLGPAPQPGGRITVGAAQLGAIARGYGIDWQPASDADQAVLSRPGAALPQDAILQTLRPALAAQGAGADFDIALPFYDPPMLDAGAAPRLHVEQMSLDPASGRFAALLAVETGAGEPLRLRLAGSVIAAVAVAVPTRRLLAGATIGPGDLALRRVRAGLVTGVVVQDPAEALGLQLRHMEFPGQPVPAADLQHATAVTKGDRVMMALALPGLDLGAVGVAMEAGAVGERVAVRNPVSGAVLTAEITGADQVRVDPDGRAAPPGAKAGFAVAAR